MLKNSLTWHSKVVYTKWQNKGHKMGAFFLKKIGAVRPRNSPGGTLDLKHHIKGKIAAELKFGTMLLKDNFLMNILTPPPQQLKIGTEKQFLPNYIVEE